MRKQRLIQLILIFNLCLNLAGCTLFEPASPTASYLKIDSIFLNTDYATQGSVSKKITDVWVFYDKQYIGTFPLPAIIPLMGEGSHEVSVKGGIIENGISGSRAAYPKYASFDTAINFTATDTINLNPSVNYISGAVFPQIEDFDDASLSLVTTNADNAPLLITNSGDPDAFEGNSGEAMMDANKPVFEVASSSAFFLPLNIPVYLELNFKGNVDCTIGVFQSTQSGVIKSDLLTLRASSEWKKIYVTFSELGGVAPNVIDYKVYLHAEKEASQTTANVYFDNLKVIY